MPQLGGNIIKSTVLHLLTANNMDVLLILLPLISFNTVILIIATCAIHIILIQHIEVFITLNTLFYSHEDLGKNTYCAVIGANDLLLNTSLIY